MHKAYMPLLLTVAVILVVLLQFGFLVLLLALLPAIMAYFIDGNEGRPMFKTVLTCNLTGALPSLTPMLKAGLQFQHADISGVMASPHVWLFIYGGAAAGWGLIYLCRFIANFLLIIMYEYKILALERFQKKLMEEWGQQISEG
jgi:hypothetical protein